jgi:transketolase
MMNLTNNMRAQFAEELRVKMQTNRKIFLLTADLGYGMFDKIKEEFPEQFLNTGAAEQTMLDIAVGMAYSGMTPFCYSITPFLLYRGFETIRTYICHEQLNVKLIGGGRNDDYKHDGFSHDATDDLKIMMNLRLNIRKPESIEEMKYDLDELISIKEPYYINLTR